MGKFNCIFTPIRNNGTCKREKLGKYEFKKKAFSSIKLLSMMTWLKLANNERIREEKMLKGDKKMKIGTKKLQEIIESHGKWLKFEDGGKCANLQDADLHGADLQGANLRGANLRGADLQCANLRDANLRGADLQCAYLQGAGLQGAHLQGAYLRGTYLQGAGLPNGIYQIVGCGSYNRCTTYDSINDRVICGCWEDGGGNHLESFKKRIETIYGDKGEAPNAAYYIEYMAAINFFEMVKRVRKL